MISFSIVLMASVSFKIYILYYVFILGIIIIIIIIFFVKYNMHVTLVDLAAAPDVDDNEKMNQSY